MESMEFFGFIFLIFIAYMIFVSYKNARRKEAVSVAVAIIENNIKLAAELLVTQYKLPSSWISYITSRYDHFILLRASEIYQNKKYVSNVIDITAESILLTFLVEIKEATNSLEKKGALLDAGFDLTIDNINFVIYTYENFK